MCSPWIEDGDSSAFQLCYTPHIPGTTAYERISVQAQYPFRSTQTPYIIERRSFGNSLLQHSRSDGTPMPSLDELASAGRRG